MGLLPQKSTSGFGCCEIVSNSLAFATEGAWTAAEALTPTISMAAKVAWLFYTNAVVGSEQAGALGRLSSHFFILTPAKDLLRRVAAAVE